MMPWVAALRSGVHFIGAFAASVIVASYVVALALGLYSALMSPFADERTFDLQFVAALTLFVAVIALPTMAVVALPALVLARARGWASAWRRLCLVGMIAGAFSAIMVQALIANSVAHFEDLLPFVGVGAASGLAAATCWWVLFERSYSRKLSHVGI